jgi:dipeptidyl-peptidase 4
MHLTTFAALLLSCGSLTLTAQETTPAIVKTLLKTIAEKSDYQATANEQQVLNFLQSLDDSSPRASQLSIGKTIEGRSIQALVLAKEEKITLPLPATDNRMVIVLLGGIHSGECDGKEALLALARDLLADRESKILDQAVLAFIPNFNADGNERVGLLHRPGQDGPAQGMGTRENAIGLDLNRDFIKLDTPEVRSLVRALDYWNADVLIDTHTTNGSLHQYDLTYDVPHNPAANPSVVAWLRKTMLPAITKEMNLQGFPTFYYGNFSDDHKRWESFGHEPRYSTEYMGLRGKIGILVESYSYASYQRRIDASYLFVEACLKQLTENAANVKALMKPPAEASSNSLPIQAKIVPDETTMTAKGFAWSNGDKPKTVASASDAPVEEDDDHIYSAPVTDRPSKFPTPKDRKRKSEMEPTDFEVQLLNVGQSTLAIDPPEYYFVPSDAAWAASRLRMHGVRMAWVESSTLAKMPKQMATQYRMENTQELMEYQNRRLRKFEVAKSEIELPAASGWLVPTRQPLGTLAAYMLEPHADDSLATWGFFDPSLTKGSLYSVLRIEKPFAQAMTTTPVKPLELGAASPETMAKEPLTLEKIFDPNKRLSLVGPPTAFPKWLPDSQSYLTQQEGKWNAVDCKTGAMQPWDRTKRLVDALGKLEAFQDGQANAYLRRINVFDSKLENALLSQKGDYYLVQLANDLSGTTKAIASPKDTTSPKDTVRQITHSPEQVKELPELSPTGKHVAYIHSNNIWVVDCETTEVRKLTQEGGGEILCGKLDWVYQEEVYGRGMFKGYWWSPDGTAIAYLRLDETAVPRFQIDNSLSFAQSLEETRYPKSGQPNPLATLHVVQVATGKSQEIPIDDYPLDDRIIVRVGWNPTPGQNDVVFQVQNRIQSRLDLLSYDLSDKKISALATEISPAWVDVIDEPRWLPDGSFLWLSDAGNGRRHIYRIAKDGTRNKVTDGDWDVKSIESIDTDGQHAWLLAHRSSPINTDLLRLDLDNNKFEAVGEPNGTHRVSIHPSGDFWLDSWSDASNPSQMWLRDETGKKIRYLGGYRSDRFETLKAAQVELLEIKARDGLSMQAMLYKPTDFADRIKTGKMPVLMHVYGGPAARTVENNWTHRSDLWHRYLAEQGICVLLCDNRSALGRGNSDTWKIYKDLGTTEQRDLEDAVSWLNQQPWVDSKRIGLWGWSYGGYFTAYAMTHCTLFKAGIAGAPVTDWNNYDSIYTERYMDTPKRNPDGYKSSSVVESAKNLSGRLMLIHGEIDDNVHIANTMQLANALQQANKRFDLMVYPNNRHGISDPEQVYHQYQMMTNFFMEQLGL